MLDQPVPNPLVKNPNVHTHKVFASVGLILFGTIVILGILAYIYKGQVGDFLKGAPNGPSIDNPVKPGSIATESATKDETSDWKTYTNQIMGFEFKYPNEWSLSSENNGNQVKDVQFSSASTYDGFNKKLNFIVTTDPTLTTQTSYEETEKMKVGDVKTINPTIDSPYKTKITRLRNIDFADVTGLKTESIQTPEPNSGIPGGKGIDIYFKKDSYYGRIGLWISEDDSLFKASEEQLNQLLATFKFL